MSDILDAIDAIKEARDTYEEANDFRNSIDQDWDSADFDDPVFDEIVKNALSLMSDRLKEMEAKIRDLCRQAAEAK